VVVNRHPDGKDASQKIETQYPCRCPHGRLCRRAKGRILEQQGRNTSLRAEAAPPRNSQRNASERALSKALQKKNRCKKEKPPRVGLTGLSRSFLGSKAGHLIVARASFPPQPKRAPPVAKTVPNDCIDTWIELFCKLLVTKH